MRGASLVLYDDGEERVKDLDAVEWRSVGVVDRTCCPLLSQRAEVARQSIEV